MAGEGSSHKLFSFGAHKNTEDKNQSEKSSELSAINPWYSQSIA